MASFFCCCFPSVSTVMTPDGPKRMDELEIGDRVLDRNSKWTTVYTFQHKVEPLDQLRFVEIHMGDRAVIRISANHLIFRRNQLGEIEDVEAFYINQGDTVFLNNRAVKVSQVYSILDHGKYAPVTFSGSMLVDGVWVTCYATSPGRVSDTLNAMIHFVHDYAWAPLRTLARLIDWLGLMNLEMVKGILDPDADVEVSFWYIRLLESIGSIF